MGITAHDSVGLRSLPIPKAILYKKTSRNVKGENMKDLLCNIKESISDSPQYCGVKMNSFNESELQRAETILDQVKHLASPMKERELVRLVILQSGIMNH